MLNQRNVGLPKQWYKLAYYLKLVATNYDKTQQQQHHFPQIFILQKNLIPQVFSTTKILQITPS